MRVRYESYCVLDLSLLIFITVQFLHRIRSQQFSTCNNKLGWILQNTVIRSVVDRRCHRYGRSSSLSRQWSLNLADRKRAMNIFTALSVSHLQFRDIPFVIGPFRKKFTFNGVHQPKTYHNNPMLMLSIRTLSLIQPRLTLLDSRSIDWLLDAN